MACLDNIQIQQTVTYNTLPNTVNGYIEGEVLVEILNAGAASIEGTVTVDKVRDTTEDILESSVEQIDVIIGGTQTFPYKFYYPNNEPESIIINVAVDLRIDDCLYYGECNHVLLADNSGVEQSSCLVESQGFEVVSGCTNPLFYEYNSLANVDDGSCENLIPILGCTNPLATNYNPNATKNDGSCIFPSGCTNPIANNYEPNAVIDDGSCACGDINLQLNFFDFSGESFVLSGDCEYYLEFDLITKVDCGKFIDYFENDTRTVLEILNNLKINAQLHALLDGDGELFEYSGGTLMLTGTSDFLLAQTENIFEFDIENIPIGIGLKGGEDDCDTFFDLLATNLGLECKTFDRSKFDVKWESYKFVINSDLLNTFTKFVLNFENFAFGICAYVDNLKVSSICTEKFEKCVLIPTTYGFELEKIKDNKKSWVYIEDKTIRSFDQIETRETEYLDYESRLTFNTKELELQINPVKYIESDVQAYYEYFNRFYSSIDNRLTEITEELLKYEYIDVTNRQTIRSYSFLPTIYQRYLDELDCAASKMLNYGYGFDIISEVGKFWYDLVKNLVPATAIWNENEYVLKNNIFQQQKHRYKKYTLTSGDGTGNCAASGSTIACQTLSNNCFDVEFNNIDELLLEGKSDVICLKTGDTVCYTDFIGDGSFTGKLIQYSETTGDSIEVIQLIGFDDYTCTTGETDICDGVIINPNVSYDCIQASGANTGFAILNINPSGGTAPYSISGGFSGQTVEDGDVISIVVMDSNGCASDIVDGTVTIDCPSGGTTGETCANPVNCDGNTNTFALKVDITNISTSLGFGGYSIENILSSTSGYSGVVVGSYKVSGLPVPEIVSSNNLYHSAADLTPEIGLSDYMEFGFNQFTPTTPSNTDSPWDFVVFEDADIPDWTVGGTITYTVTLYDEDYCVHKGTGSITLPADGVTNSIVINF